MGKYLAVISNSMKRNLAYRANSIITVVSVFFSFIVLFYFWSSIYRQGNQIGTYSLEAIISYYVLVTIFELLVVGDNTSWSVGEEIKSGQITSAILKPISYLKYKVSQSIGGILYRLLIFILPIIGVVFLLKDFLVVADDRGVFGFVLLSAVLSYILYFLIYFIVGMSGFWTGDAQGFNFTAMVIINFMQGSFIPLDLLPKWILTVSDYLPFKFLFFVPVGVMTDRLDFDFSMIFIPLAWCVVLYQLAQFMYKKGLKKYEGYGA